MTLTNPKKQRTENIVDDLLVNESRQYTESAHAEIFRRLINTIQEFNSKSEKTTNFMVLLAFAQVLLALAQIFLAFKK